MVIYSRVSTGEQAGSGLGLEAQRAKCSAYATAMELNVAEFAEDAGVSGTVAPDDRAGLGSALAALDNGEANCLIAASLSRIGRRTADVLALADRADKHGWSLIVLDLALDTRTPTGRFALTMLSAVAQLERDQTSQRTREALAAKKACGDKLGRPVSKASMAAGKRATELRESGLSFAKVAAALTREGYARRSSTADWTPAAARDAINSYKRMSE